MGLVQAMFELHLIGVRFQVSLSLKKMTDSMFKIIKLCTLYAQKITEQMFLNAKARN